LPNNRREPGLELCLGKKPTFSEKRQGRLRASPRRKGAAKKKLLGTPTSSISGNEKADALVSQGKGKERKKKEASRTLTGQERNLLTEGRRARWRLKKKRVAGTRKRRKKKKRVAITRLQPGPQATAAVEKGRGPGDRGGKKGRGREPSVKPAQQPLFFEVAYYDLLADRGSASTAHFFCRKKTTSLN